MHCSPKLTRLVEKTLHSRHTSRIARTAVQVQTRRPGKLGVCTVRLEHSNIRATAIREAKTGQEKNTKPVLRELNKEQHGFI